MPFFFFDTLIGTRFISDDDGVDLPDLEAAKRTASLSLAELARDIIPVGDPQVLTVVVRDSESPIFEARLTFDTVLHREKER